MKLTAVIIHNFRSIGQDCRLQIDDAVTTLVGANNSGKTNILRALERISRGSVEIDDLCGFSPAGRSPQPDSNLPMITASFELTPEERETLVADHGVQGNPDNFDVTRHYGGHFTLNVPGSNPPTERPNAEPMLAIFEQLRALLVGSTETPERFDSTIQLITEVENQLMAITETQVTRSESLASRLVEPLVDDLVTVGEALNQESDEEAEPGAQTAISSLKTELESLARRYDTPDAIGLSSPIISLLPNFIFVGSEPDTLLQGTVNLDELERSGGREPRFTSARRLIGLADLDVAHLRELTPVQRRRVLRQASQKLTQLLGAIWEQEKLTISLETTGANDRDLLIWISSNGSEDLPPESQGYGFRWYLEFYLAYVAAGADEPGRSVMLLDEAGNHLHPLAQRNLVERLNEISALNQVIHTTHSEDMLDFDNPDRWRVAVKDELGVGGTQIINAAYQPTVADGHIGFEVVMKALWGSSVPYLVAGPRNLVVEGPSDFIYIRVMARILVADDDQLSMFITEKIAIFPAHGVSRYRKAPIYCSRPGFRTAALFDSDEAGRQMKKIMIERGEIDAQATVEINDIYSPTNQERDIEDIFGFLLYKQAALSVYAEELSQDFDFKSSGLPQLGGLGQRFKSYFEEKGVRQFDKTRVAESLRDLIIQEPGKLTTNTRDRFRDLLVRIRAALELDPISESEGSTPDASEHDPEAPSAAEDAFDEGTMPVREGTGNTGTSPAGASSVTGPGQDQTIERPSAELPGPDAIQ